jgi:CheY-like chemotaxis protein
MADLYNCFYCDALNRASKNAWCFCAGNENTLVCERCGKCSCGAPSFWKRNVWDPILEALLERKATVYQRPVILIIDDDRVIHSVAARILEKFAGSVLHAYDGAEGLRMARETSPDLVITDCLMPLMDGREISKALKSDPATSNTRIVAMTALYRGVRYRHEALRDFAVDQYIEKPVSALALQKIIDDTFQEVSQ